ncbi:MAG TPA: sugar ABC transporter substrate-binding protein [Spirochaetia bacterium]|nr:sugar ABC transporter substrate-binding protein [Spirochaetia bacterium]
MKKWTLSILVLALLAFPLFAGGQKEQAASAGNGPVTLTFTDWSGFKGHVDLLNSIAQAYAQQHSNVSVNYVTIPFGDYVSKLTLELAGSNPPDAGWLVETSAPTFVDAGVLANLTQAVQKYNFADFSKPAMKLWEKSDQVYGIPFSTSPFVILYNKDLFKKAGIGDPVELAQKGQWTWADFRQIAKTIKEKTGVFAYEGPDGEGYGARVWYTLVPIIRAYGGNAWSATGACGMASPEAVQAVQLFHDMIFTDKSVVPPGDLSDFYAGNAAMTMGQISRVGKLQDASFAWGLAPLPTGPAGRADVIGQAAVVAFNAGKHAAIASDFVAFMTNEENVTKMSEYFPPARLSVMNSAAFLKANPLIPPEIMQSVVVAAMKDGTVAPYNANFPKIDLVSRAEFDKLWTPNADVKQVLTGLCTKIAPLLKQ